MDFFMLLFFYMETGKCFALSTEHILCMAKIITHIATAQMKIQGNDVSCAHHILVSLWF